MSVVALAVGTPIGCTKTPDTARVEVSATNMPVPVAPKLIVGVNSIELIPVTPFAPPVVTVSGPCEALLGTVTVIEVSLLADTMA